jgi:hypothetical protein
MVDPMGTNERAMYVDQKGSLRCGEARPTQLRRPFITAARDQVESEHVDSSGRNRMPI